MDQTFLQHAEQLACDNVTASQGGPFGALIVKGQQIVATGVNTVTYGNDPTAHAEINAIRSACSNLNSFQLKGCILYSSCEPCPMCLAAIYWARLDRVFFSSNRNDAAAAGFDDEFIYQQLALAPGQRAIPMEELRTTNSQQPLKLWVNMDKKIPY